MSQRKIDFSKMPPEFQHLDKKDQAKLVYQAQDIGKKLEQLPPESMHDFIRQITKIRTGTG